MTIIISYTKLAKITTNKYKNFKFDRKRRDGSDKKHRNKSSSDGKLILGDIPTSHL